MVEFFLSVGLQLVVEVEGEGVVFAVLVGVGLVLVAVFQIRFLGEGVEVGRVHSQIAALIQLVQLMKMTVERVAS